MRSSPRPRAAVLVAALVLLLHALPPVATPAAAATAVERISGSDRIATAVAVARAAFPEGASTAVVARADAFPDAMAAAALAGAYGGPVLLSDSTSVPPALTDALRDLGVRTVVLVGGPGALSPDVRAELARRVAVDRLEGVDRYDTAAEIAKRTAQVAGGVGRLDGRRTAFLANGEAFPDALAAGPLAFAGAHPILLTRKSDLPDATRKAIQSLGVQHVVVLGGTGAVAPAVREEVERLGATVERIGGNTRTATAARIADLALTRFGLDAAEPQLVRGDAFADALVAGPAGGRRGSPLLLTASPGDASWDTRQWFASRCEDVGTVHAIGGESAVSLSALTAVRRAAEECHVSVAQGVLGTAVNGASTGPTAYHDPALGRRLTYLDLRPSGTVRSTRDGQVIEKLDIAGQVIIAHDDVTVRAVRITNPGGSYSVSYAAGSGASGARLEYVEIDGTATSSNIGVYLDHFTMRHSHVYGHSTGVRFGSGSTIEHSYVHSQTLAPGSHNTAMSIHGGGGVVIRGNNLQGSTSSALSLYPNLSPLKDILIEGNVFNGGSYCTYGGSPPKANGKPYWNQTERVRYVGNGFGRELYARCGIHGPVTTFSTSRPGNLWTGNVWVDDGSTVPPS